MWVCTGPISNREGRYQYEDMVAVRRVICMCAGLVRVWGLLWWVVRGLMVGLVQAKLLTQSVKSLVFQ